MKKFLTTLVLAVLSLTAMAQTDYTSKITNPSFENDWTGWTHKGMGLQGNTSFSIKAGKTYAEKWTGKGGAVGDGSISQVITDLPPGNYELTAAAQNIQEDSPEADQTGAYIFAGDKKTKVSVRNIYTVAFTYVSGKITIGFEAVGASGNWIAVDNFRLTLVGQQLIPELTAAIAEAETLYGDGSGNEAAQLLAAIETARAIVETGESAPGEDQANALVALTDAIYVYRAANASEEMPLDLTNAIDNPSFENGLEGWTASGMGTQGNSAFSIKQGNIYVEKWVGSGNAVGDGYVRQTVKNMRPGRYQLKAAAQNIQESSSKAQTGACIFANTHEEPVTTRKEYTLSFVLVSDQMEIGFKAEGATGNWIAVDNFRLYYTSDNFDLIKEEYQALIAKAEELAAKKTNTPAHNALQSAIDAAKALLDATDASQWSVPARELEAAYKTAKVSQEVFARLNVAIEEAQTAIDNLAEGNKEEYQAAIDEARSIYNADTTTDAQAEAAIEALAKAGFAFRIANGTGTAPRVTTDKRFVRGATWAFGRSTVSGSNIMEKGFCWSENPDPKVTDNRTTEYLNQAGMIYWIRDLKPATVYYMRAYAINKTYAVGYGDVIKVVTIPKGTMGWWYNNGGDEEVNARLNNAIGSTVDYYWNNLANIHGMGLSVSYSPGTPTADCSYGGSMRVGASTAYQSIGTIMHEAFHAIGVGTHGNWWSGDYRPDGKWAGIRVTEALRFWDNSTDEVLSGDDMHLWPYGCNGAHEDTHSDNQYCMMGILAQALGEDGLPASGEIGYALPYYSFNHEDGVKYYIKNEDESRGLYNSFLVETSTHQLQWKAMSAEEAAADDNAAWYLSFSPNNQYYQLKNAATGYYMTYSSGFKTAKHTNPTSADNIHIMPGHVEVKGHRTYYMIHPESTGNPPTLVANASSKTASTSWNISNSATTQRWLILTAEESQALETAAVALSKKELTDLTAQIRKLTQTPHTEDVEDVDNTLLGTLDNIDAEGAVATSTTVLTNLMGQAREAGMTFLEGVSATDVDNPFNVTFLIQNPEFKADATTGWTTNAAPNYSNGIAEFFQKSFNFNQTLTNMPSGVYLLRANAFQRPGEESAMYKQYTAGTATVSTYLYIGSNSTTVKHICDDSQRRYVLSSDTKLAASVYVPNSMEGASKYFAKGLYDNSIVAEVTTPGSSLKFGIRCSKSSTGLWTAFDNFRLLFYGKNRTMVGIREVESAPQVKDDVIYDLSGRKVSAPKSGLYIINGKKVVVK